MKTIRIVTKTEKGEVHTAYSDDPFHNFGVWQSTLVIPDLLAIAIMRYSKYADCRFMKPADTIYSGTYKEAGKAHLKLCEKLK